MHKYTIADFSDSIRQHLTPERIELVIENAQKCGMSKIVLPVEIGPDKFDSLWLTFDEAREFVRAS